MLTVQNLALLDLIRFDYAAKDVQAIIDLLKREGAFKFPQFPNGLFPASGFDPRKHKITGYQNGWVRDNVYVAYAHYVLGERAAALKNAHALVSFLKTQRHRFLAIVDGKSDPSEAMNRPHIRFNSHGREISQAWSHAQNDALGYFLWFFCQLILDKQIKVTPEELDLLGCFPLYFKAVRFWNDRDSGHWEEHPKVEASSIGVVCAALKMLQKTMKHLNLERGWNVEKRPIDPAMVAALLDNGLRALERILPNECIQPGFKRRSDSALLFLIYPMEIVSDKVADQIIERVVGDLQGDFGIARYKGDTYWCANYPDRLSAKKRSPAYGLDSKTRDKMLEGSPEAQWCIFDPILSIIYGRRYRRSRNKADLRIQTDYINRCLGQITGPSFAGGQFRCPELYYSQDGRYIPNPHTPLLWAQSNLWLALECLRENLG
jgi:phosphorylase kinase alpha/beta subunit